MNDAEIASVAHIIGWRLVGYGMFRQTSSCSEFFTVRKGVRDKPQPGFEPVWVWKDPSSNTHYMPAREGRPPELFWQAKEEALKQILLARNEAEDERTMATRAQLEAQQILETANRQATS